MKLIFFITIPVIILLVIVLIYRLRSKDKPKTGNLNVGNTVGCNTNRNLAVCQGGNWEHVDDDDPPGSRCNCNAQGIKCTGDRTRTCVCDKDSHLDPDSACAKCKDGYQPVPRDPSLPYNKDTNTTTIMFYGSPIETQCEKIPPPPPIACQPSCAGGYNFGDTHVTLGKCENNKCSCSNPDGEPSSAGDWNTWASSQGMASTYQQTVDDNPIRGDLNPCGVCFPDGVNVSNTDIKPSIPGGNRCINTEKSIACCSGNCSYPSNGTDAGTELQCGTGHCVSQNPLDLVCPSITDPTECRKQTFVFGAIPMCDWVVD